MFVGDASVADGRRLLRRGDLLDERLHLDVVGAVARDRLPLLAPHPRLDVGHHQVVVVPVDVALALGHLGLEPQLGRAVVGRLELQLPLELRPQLLVVQTAPRNHAATRRRTGYLLKSVQQTGRSVAESLACWTRAQKGPGSNRSRDAVR